MEMVGREDRRRSRALRILVMARQVIYLMIMKMRLLICCELVLLMDSMNT